MERIARISTTSGGSSDQAVDPWADQPDAAQRLGHAKTDITNDIYAHALPSMQKDAAAKMASLLR